MGFSDDMRTGLGTDGVQVDLRVAGNDHRGTRGHAKVRLQGGASQTRVDGLFLRVMEARRHWLDQQGQRLEEEQVRQLSDRSHLTPGWSRRIIKETRIELGHTLDAGEAREVSVEFDVPEDCGQSSPACAVTLHAQADVKGQIDPTATGTLNIA